MSCSTIGLTLDFPSEVLGLAGVGQVERLSGMLETVESGSEGREEGRKRGLVAGISHGNWHRELRRSHWIEEGGGESQRSSGRVSTWSAVSASKGRATSISLL